jgi:hypothetical protein
MTKPALEPFDQQLTKLLSNVQILTGVPSVEVATTGFVVGMVFRALRLLQRTAEASREVQDSHDGLVRTEDVIGEPLFNAPNLARLRLTFENQSNQQQYPDLFAALEHERQAAFNPNDPGQDRAIWRLQVGWKYLRAVVKRGQFNLPVLNEQLEGILLQAPSASKYQRLLDGLEGLLPETPFDVQDLIVWSKDRFVGQLQNQLLDLGQIDAEGQRKLAARFKEALESAITGEDGALPAALERVKEKRLEALNEQLDQAKAELTKIEQTPIDEGQPDEGQPDPTKAEETKAEAIKAKQAQIDALTKEITRVTEVKVDL